MDGTIALRRSERKTLLDHYRRHPDPAVRLRAHLLLLLAAGYPWATIVAVLFCSTRTIARWKRRFEQGGVPAVLGIQAGDNPRILQSKLMVYLSPRLREKLENEKSS